jgi:hypothetical protein
MIVIPLQQFLQRGECALQRARRRAGLSSAAAQRILD